MYERSAGRNLLSFGWALIHFASADTTSSPAPSLHEALCCSVLASNLTRMLAYRLLSLLFRILSIVIKPGNTCPPSVNPTVPSRGKPIMGWDISMGRMTSLLDGEGATGHIPTWRFGLGSFWMCIWIWGTMEWGVLGSWEPWRYQPAWRNRRQWLCGSCSCLLGRHAEEQNFMESEACDDSCAWFAVRIRCQHLR